MAILYSSRMESLSFFDETAGFPNLIPHWGINDGNTVTCSNSRTSKYATSLTTQLNQGTIRWQYGYLYIGDGINDDAPSIASFFCANSVGSISNRNFGVSITLEINGALSLTFINSSSTGGGTTKITSTSGVIIRDGRINAFQFRFNFPTHTTIEYNLLVNNVSILSGTFINTVSFLCILDSLTKNHWMRYPNGTMSNCNQTLDIAGINQIDIQSVYKHFVDADWVSSFVELIIDDSNAVVSYLPNNAPTIALGACSGALPPVEPPEPETPVGTGIYFINPLKATKHDSYYGSVEKKIPNPTVKTALLGE